MISSSSFFDEQGIEELIYDYDKTSICQKTRTCIRTSTERFGLKYETFGNAAILQLILAPPMFDNGLKLVI